MAYLPRRRRPPHLTEVKTPYTSFSSATFRGASIRGGNGRTNGFLSLHMPAHTTTRRDEIGRATPAGRHADISQAYVADTFRFSVFDAAA